MITNSRRLIAEASSNDAACLTQFRSEKTADKIHAVRNTLAAAVAACAFLIGADADAGIARLARVCVRGSKARSLTDDEIVLLRIMILRDAKVGGRRTISSARYFMADAGVHPSETTVVTPAMMELNAERQPTSIDVPGVNERVAARTVQLDDFVRCGLAGIVAQHLTRHANADTSPLGYSGTYPAGGHYASASASSGLKKLFARAGLDSNLKPLGLVQWRIEHTLAHKGLDAALQLSGKKHADALGHLIKTQIDQTPKKRRTVLDLRPEQVENAAALIVESKSAANN